MYLAASLVLDTAETSPDAPFRRVLLRARQTGLDRLAGLAYYVGLPFVAMLAGAADFPLHLGLAGMDWPASLARGAGLGVAVFVGLAGIAGYARRHGLGQRASGESNTDWDAWLVALCQQAHWAFYRLPAILLTGDFLLGTSLGATLALLERVADPRWRRQATSADAALGAWLDVALLVGMSAVFYLVRNFFVLWGVHALLIWAVRKAFR
ncbi:MAG: hypothetical protein Kow00123_01160 [Anaerolineales bacterium]